MKQAKSKLWSVPIVILICFVLTIGIVGCSKDAPFSSNNSSNDFAGAKKGISLISYNTSHSLFKKIHTASEWITQSSGGEVYIQVLDSVTSEIHGAAKLVIDSASIDQDKMVTMEVDDEVLDFYFGPSGTQFAPEARFSFYMKGLDLTGMDPATINLFYYNPNTGNWEVVPSDGVYVNASYGYIRIRNAQLSHFSRYGIGAE